MADGTLLMEDARIIFRNFAGKEGKYNREGDRNFCVLLDQDLAERMERDGWNIKALRGREADDPEQPYIQVSVGFKNRPPKMVMVTSKGRTTLTEEECEIFDWVDIRSVDLIIRAYKWDVSGKTGIKAYLKTIVVIIEEDELDLKYADLEELPSRSGKVLELPAAQEARVIEGEWQ
jgi:hypothetical protein